MNDNGEISVNLSSAFEIPDEWHSLQTYLTTKPAWNPNLL
jgi:hypothetical protein